MDRASVSVFQSGAAGSLRSTGEIVMRGTIKRALRLAAVLAIGAVAPAAATAAEWTEGFAQFNGPAHAVGALTLTMPAAVEVTCDVDAELDLTNTAAAPDRANGGVLGLATSGCWTTASNCSATVAAIPVSLPWGIGTVGSSVTISGVRLVTWFGGVGCPLNGVPVEGMGAFTGSSSWNVVSFVGAGPLASTFGPFWVDGDLELYADDGSGSVDLGRPIALF